MSQPSNGSRSEETQGGPKAGQILLKARLAAHIEVNKICADLRISAQSLDALEQGHYHLLPGDPYVRALLGSISRYLGVDPAVVVKEYSREIGAAPQAPAAAPYTDKAASHSTAHRQIFVVIVAVLFVVLFIVIGRLNRGNEGTAPAANGPAQADGPAAPGDTTLESRALAPDSAALPDSAIRDTARVKKSPGSASAPVPVPLPATTPASAPAAASASATSATPGIQGPQPAGSPADTAGLVVAVIKPLVDSVGVRIARYGKEDVSTLLRLGKQMQVSHPDTIVVYTSRPKTVEVTLGGQTFNPGKKRFKIYGKTVKAF